MASIVGLTDLTKSLIESGNNLLNPNSSTEELLTLLDETESLLRNVEQDPPLSMQNALIPSKNALVSVDLFSHPDSDVRVSVVSCLNEIMRITAPEAPYSDDQMKEIFRLTIEAFEKLADVSSRSYRKAESVLDNVSKVRSCLVMLDLECNDLILQMFRNFLRIIRSNHPQVVFSSMEMIMITIVDETEEVSVDLLNVLLASVKKENKNVAPLSWRLVEKVLSRCARKLKPYIIEALKSPGTSLDMYSQVVTSVCQSVFDPPRAHNEVNTKENEAAAIKLGRQSAPSVSLEEKLDLGHSLKEIRSKSSSKRPTRDGTRRINEDDKERNGNKSDLSKQSLKQVRSESTDAEKESGVTGKRGRKPNSFMNPEEGYDISLAFGKKDPLKTSWNRKIKRKGSGGESSLRKLVAKKTPLPKETSTATSRALTGSLKRSRVKIDESDHDLDSLSSPRLKKLALCVQDEEPPEEESDQESFEKLEDQRENGNPSKETSSHNSIEKSQKTAKKEPIVEVNSSVKRSSARSEAKRKHSELDTPVLQSSKRKKMVSQVAARQLAEDSEETSKKRRTARKEVETDLNSLGRDLVGKRVNIWWPLDRTFYEGVIKSYCSRRKTHRVVYSDGETEDLNLSKERWEILEDHTSADEEDMEIDLPESMPLFDIMQRQKAKKRKNVAVSVEPTRSSSGVRFSRSTLGKKGSGRKLNKQVERGKAESRQGKHLKSLKELNAETDRAEEEEEEEEQEVSRDENEDDDCSEKQEQSENESEESLKSADDTEAKTKGLNAETDGTEEEQEDDDCSEKREESENNGEEKQNATSEVESEREDSGSEEEPKWRETEDMEEEDEAEKVGDDKGSNASLSETEKEDQDRES